MKNLILSTLSVLYILLLSNKAFAQDNTIDSTQNIFKNQKELEAQMSKFGLKTLEFPENDFCQRGGPPVVKHGDKLIPNLPYNPEPEEKFPGDTLPGVWDNVAGDINIFWIHGLNGYTGSLRVPAMTTQYGDGSTFPARKVNSIRGVASSISNPVQLYSEDGSITDATGDINNYCKTVLDISKRTNRDYIIAHSQGGIVAREWLRNMEQKPTMYENFAHGLVTFGTPHWGAQVLNNTRPELKNKVPYFMNEACQALSGPIIEGSIKNTFFTSLVITPTLKNKIKDALCATLSETIIPLALVNYFKPTTRDFYVGSPFLTGKNDANGLHTQGLAEYALKVPVVQFYGEEEQPILWKFLSSTRGLGHDELSNADINYGYTQDDQMEKDVSDKISDYSAGRDAANIEKIRLQNSVYGNFVAFFNGTRRRVRDLEKLEHAYNNAYVWLSNANDYYLAELIGGRTSTTSVASCLIIENLFCKDTTIIGTTFPLVRLNFSYNVGPDSSGKACDVAALGIKYKNYSFPGLDGKTWHGYCFGSQTAIPTWKVTSTYIPNDGVVLAESAGRKILVDRSNDPRITHRVGIMPKTNHDQMKNCLETKKALLDLYQGEKYGRFFKLDPR